ncbi:MAG: GNAT family N-acetyltransferase [Litorimonas sp.]
MQTNNIEWIEGPSLVLRLVQPEDAQYLFDLRTDTAYNEHLSRVDGLVADQRRWIEDYKLREAERQELYYIIERHDGTRCGTVRLYEISDENFTWGSWILDQAKPRKAALESAVLSFGVGFQMLDLKFARIDVRKKNSHAEAFYRRLGMSETRQTETDIFFSYSRTQYQSDHAHYLGILTKEVPT